MLARGSGRRRASLDFPGLLPASYRSDRPALDSLKKLILPLAYFRLGSRFGKRDVAARRTSSLQQRTRTSFHWERRLFVRSATSEESLHSREE